MLGLGKCMNWHKGILCKHNYATLTGIKTHHFVHKLKAPAWSLSATNTDFRVCFYSLLFHSTWGGSTLELPAMKEA